MRGRRESGLRAAESAGFCICWGVARQAAPCRARSGWIPSSAWQLAGRSPGTAQPTLALPSLSHLDARQQERNHPADGDGQPAVDGGQRQGQEGEPGQQEAAGVPRVAAWATGRHRQGSCGPRCAAWAAGWHQWRTGGPRVASRMHGRRGALTVGWWAAAERLVLPRYFTGGGGCSSFALEWFEAAKLT